MTRKKPKMKNQTEQTELAVATQEKMEVAAPAPDPGQILKAVLDKGVTAESAAVVEKVLAMYERMEDRKAERDFAKAFNALQAEMSAVKAVQPVPNNDGTIRYKFAPFEDIMEQVSPFLKRHGFTVSFSTRFEEARLVKICTLQHLSGHKVSNEFAVRIGKGPPGSSEAQGDGAASTYAKRFALCDALNIVIEKDLDAKAEGAKITKDQASELRQRVRACGADEAAFLKFAQAETYEDIMETRYASLDHNLRRKESTK